MNNINHEAALEYAQANNTLDQWPVIRNLSGAYLDLDAKLTEMSKYMSDCTPLQSDDFSRGESYGADCCARLINDVLDGNTDGVMWEPLGSARQRLIDYIEAERQRVDRLAELVESCAELTKLSRPKVSQAITEALTAIMEGRDNG